MKLRIEKGLPGKSYLYVAELDLYLKLALSPFSNLSFFDNYVMCLVTWKFRYKDREKMVKDFIMFMLIYDESRIDFLLCSKYFKRSFFISFLKQVNNSLKSVDDILEKKDYTYDDFFMLYNIKSKLHPYNIAIYNFVPLLCKKISMTLDTILSHYLSFTIKGLMLKRHGISDPASLKTDAYNTIIEMIDNYDYNKSMIPFNNYLVFFIKSSKNKIIKQELWNLKEGLLVPLQDKNEKESIDKLEINKSIVEEGGIKGLEVVDKFIVDLPLIFQKILILNFGILQSLTKEKGV